MAINMVAVAGNGAPALVLYDVASQSVIPTSALANDLGLSATAYSCAFSPDGSVLAITHSAPPYITVVNTSDWSKVVSASLVLPISASGRCTFSRDGSKLAVVQRGTGSLTVFNTSDWSKVVSASLSVSGGVYGCAFSPDGSRMAVAHTGSPYLTVFNTSDWSKVVAASLTLPGYCVGCSFSPDGSKLAAAHSGGTNLTVFNASDWSKVVSASLSITANGFGCAFSPDGTRLATLSSGPPHMALFNTSTWTKYSLPSAALSGTGTSCEFRPDGSGVLFLHSIYPFVTELDVSTLAASANATYGVHFLPEVVSFASAGPRFIRGSVRDSAGAVAARNVRVRRRSDGVRQAFVASDPVTGDFEATVYSGDVEYDVQFLAASGEPLNDLFFARVTSSET